MPAPTNKELRKAIANAEATIRAAENAALAEREREQALGSAYANATRVRPEALPRSLQPRG